MQILNAGGMLMYVILLMGIIGLYAILERFSYFLIKERKNFSKLPSDVRQLISEGKIKEAIIFLNSNKSSTAVVLKDILIYGYKENKESLSALEEKGKEKAIEQLKSLERNMWLISMAAHTSPFYSIQLHSTTPYSLKWFNNSVQVFSISLTIKSILLLK